MTDKNRLWTYTKSLPNASSPFLPRLDLHDQGRRSADGSEAGKGEVIKQARSKNAIDEYYASPLGADGKVWMVSRKGQFTVLKAGWRTRSVGVRASSTRSATPVPRPSSRKSIAYPHRALLLRKEVAEECDTVNASMEKYDLIVIGSGPAGQRAAIQAANGQAGRAGREARGGRRRVHQYRDHSREDDARGGAAPLRLQLSEHLRHEYRVKEKITMADLASGCST